jgi:GDP-L-fucose synthase
MAEGSRFTLRGKRVWVCGAQGMLGSALVRRLANENCDVLTVPHSRLDLRDRVATTQWIGANRPDAIFVTAATVGGIHANSTRPAEFIYDNLAIAMNVVHAAFEQSVAKVMVLGSSCMYPRLAEQPVSEESLLTGPFEPTNEWYAVAKVAAHKLAQAYRRQYGCDFITVVPTNLYGPGDNFDPRASHVVPALIRRFHEAKAEDRAADPIWGTGSPRREFLFVDDAADGLVSLIESYSDEAPINVAGGTDVSIAQLAQTVAAAVGYTGPIAFDTSKPDGMPLKALDGARLRARGWAPRVSLEEGLRLTYDFFLTAADVRLG